MGLMKRFKDWNKQRIERNYERVISTYPIEEQELIRKGRNVELTGKFLKELIEENPDKEVIPLTGPGTIYHNILTGKPVGRVSKHSFVNYNQKTLGVRAYYTDVKYWLKIGELGADILYSCTTMPAGLSDANGCTHICLGIPVKIQEKD